MDLFSVTLLSFTWACMIGGGVYLQLAQSPSLRRSLNARQTLNISLIFTTFAVVFNETLLDRCWRRISIHALRGPPCGSHLRAANFEWLVTLRRAFSCSLSVREFRTATSYMLLRWGTVAAFPLIQISISISPSESLDTEDFIIKFRPWFIPIAVLVHFLALVTAFVSAGLPPLGFLKGGYGQQALQKAYQPFLDKVPMGSTATYEDVARYLEGKNDNLIEEPLTKPHQPGRQLFAKLRGIAPGIALLLFTVMLTIIYVCTWGGHSPATTFYAVQLSYLAGNVGYTLAIDNIIWQVSLESITFRGKSPRDVGTNHLNSSSGIMLAIKLFSRSTSCLAKFLMLLFLFQAAIVRILFTQMGFFWTIERNTRTQDSSTGEAYASKADFLWLIASSWVLLGPAIFIPFTIFLFIRFQAPLCNRDGWRVAKIQEDGVECLGHYGVVNGIAKFGHDVETFEVGRLL
ncbi:hypothetical protein B0T10DRAFT_467716 [Thelonectria olida]|uniref:Uncharacterized protein n=1 Tax=Thelonectria olida TaxID=1576542 RepID=A0A9P8VNM3_9HYPO|nr:hypothetical protein B0T10DRAFT_467716 [Thelonectria olida]